MKTVDRYDRVPIKATRTDEGFITDTPIISRVGIFEYRDGAGKVRRELRLPEHVFSEDSLRSIKGKPLTHGHPGRVDAKNVKAHAIGTVLSEGRADGDDLLADIIIHDPAPIDAGLRELSCGYQCVLDETPGTWNGEQYDAIQTQIKYNHLAAVEQGRAGNARLNMDAAYAVTFEEETMTMVKLRLDSGIAYDAAPEVAQEYETLTSRLDQMQVDVDAQTARADGLQAKVDTFDAEKEKMQQDALAAATERLKLEAKAAEHEVVVKADMSDRDIRTNVIQSVRGDSADLTDKSDAYIEAAYDLAIAEQIKRKDAVGSQRADSAGDSQGEPSASKSAAQARQDMIKGI